MITNASELKQVETELSEVEADLHRAEGELKYYQKEIKEKYKCNTFKKLLTVQRELMAKRKVLDKEIQDGIDQFNELFGDSGKDRKR